MGIGLACLGRRGVGRSKSSRGLGVLVELRVFGAESQVGFLTEAELDSVLSPLRELRFLGLADNLLESVAGSVVSLPNLQALDLASNQLSSIPAGPYLSSMECLDIRNNKMTEFPLAVRDLSSCAPLSRSPEIRSWG